MLLRGRFCEEMLRKADDLVLNAGIEGSFL